MLNIQGQKVKTADELDQEKEPSPYPLTTRNAERYIKMEWQRRQGTTWVLEDGYLVPTARRKQA